MGPGYCKGQPSRVDLCFNVLGILTVFDVFPYAISNSMEMGMTDVIDNFHRVALELLVNRTRKHRYEPDTLRLCVCVVRVWYDNPLQTRVVGSEKCTDLPYKNKLLSWNSRCFKYQLSSHLRSSPSPPLPTALFQAAIIALSSHHNIPGTDWPLG